MAILEQLPEDWDRALAVVAHPDDLEYGAASAVKRWTKQGKKIAYLLLTKGEAGIAGLDPELTAEVRQQEEIGSAAVVGVDDVTFLDFPDGVLEHTLDLRREITKVIRNKQPELVLTFNHHRTWPGGRLNTSDHMAAGQAAIAAVQSSGNQWIFPELAEENIEPWGGIRYLAVCGSPKLTHAVDISETIKAGVESLQQHERYLAGISSTPDEARLMLVRDAQRAGEQAGLKLAVNFEMLRF